jgi:hypothetical protein
LYPAIIPLLGKTDLSDVPVDKVAPPLPQLVVRLPKTEQSLYFDNGNQRYWLRSAFFGETNINGRPIISFAIDHGETDGRGRPLLLCRYWTRGRDVSIQKVLESIENLAEGGVDVPNEFLLRVTTILASICLLADDADLIQPDVLSNDRSNFEQTGDPKYIERARRRGKVAWTIGKTIEKVPHYRRSHLAKFWIGPGRTTPVLRLRSGGIVRRASVLEMPTGYLDDCPVCIEA